MGAALHHTLFFDGEEVGDLNNGTYVIIKAKAGEHKLHADEAKDVITFTVEAGKTYYFRTELKMGLWKGHGKINAIPEAEGAKEFESWKADNLKYSPDLKKTDALEKP